MRHHNEKVVLQAIEFWSTVFEKEFEILLDQDETGEECLNFCTLALQEICPVLLWLMSKKEDDDDEDEWNQSMAAAICLQLLATCTGGAIVPMVLPFVEENIKNPDWKFREAAVMAFGSILDGPEPHDVSPLVSMVLFW
jgi:importin subunit beta-1